MVVASARVKYGVSWLLVVDGLGLNFKSLFDSRKSHEVTPKTLFNSPKSLFESTNIQQNLLVIEFVKGTPFGFC